MRNLYYTPIHKLTKEVACRYCWTSALGGQSSKLNWIWPETTSSNIEVSLTVRRSLDQVTSRGLLHLKLCC